MLDVAHSSTTTRAALIRAFFITLGQLELTKWLIPHCRTKYPVRERDWKTVLDGELAMYNGWPKENLRGEWFKTMYVVHFFSGRRREDDSTSIPGEGGVPTRGEAGDLERRHHFWIQSRLCTTCCATAVDRWMYAGYILAFIAGPPCENL